MAGAADRTGAATAAPPGGLVRHVGQPGRRGAPAPSCRRKTGQSMGTTPTCGRPWAISTASASRPCRGRHHRGALGADALRDGVGHDRADLGPAAPVDAEPGPPVGAAVGGQRVEEAVGCGVVGLTGEPRSEAAEENSTKWSSGSPSVSSCEVPGPVHLRRQHRGEAAPSPGAAGRRRRARRPSGTRPASGGSCSAIAGEGAGHLARARDVGLQHQHLRPLRACMRAMASSASVARRAAGHQREVPRPWSASHSATSEAEPAEAAGDQVGRVLADERATGRALGGRLGAAQHDLADVAGLGHVPEGRGGVGEAKRLHGQRAPARRPRPRRPARAAAGRPSLGVILQILGQGDGVVRHVRPEARRPARRSRPRACRARRTGRRRPARRGSRRMKLAGERVEHHVHPAAGRVGQHLVGEGQRCASPSPGATPERREVGPLVRAARPCRGRGRPRAGPAATAASPTPPAAAWISTVSPRARWASRCRA